MEKVTDWFAVRRPCRLTDRAFLLAGLIVCGVLQACAQAPIETRRQCTDPLLRAEAAVAAFQERKVELSSLLTALDSLARVPYEARIGEFLCHNILLRRGEQRDDEFSSDYAVTFPCYGVLLRLGVTAIPEIFSEITTPSSRGTQSLARHAALKILGPTEFVARIREELKREDLTGEVRQSLLSIDRAVRERERRLEEVRGD